MMSLQPPLPKREAVVMIRKPGGNPELDADFDPIDLPVEVSSHGLMADVFDDRLMDLVGVLAEQNTATRELSLVWSNGFSNVMGMCPLCDQVFPVSEGAPGDIYNEGVNAVTCGCWDD